MAGDGVVLASRQTRDSAIRTGAILLPVHWVVCVVAGARWSGGAHGRPLGLCRSVAGKLLPDNICIFMLNMMDQERADAVIAAHKRACLYYADTLMTLEEFQQKYQVESQLDARLIVHWLCGRGLACIEVVSMGDGINSSSGGNSEAVDAQKTVRPILSSTIHTNELMDIFIIVGQTRPGWPTAAHRLAGAGPRHPSAPLIAVHTQPTHCPPPTAVPHTAPTGATISQTESEIAGVEVSEAAEGRGQGTRAARR